MRAELAALIHRLWAGGIPVIGWGTWEDDYALVLSGGGVVTVPRHLVHTSAPSKLALELAERCRPWWRNYVEMTRHAHDLPCFTQHELSLLLLLRWEIDRGARSADMLVV